MANIDDVGRPEPDPAANEVETLRGFLNYQRATLKWKSEGLSQDQLNMCVAQSTITLGGLLKHMTFVENEKSGLSNELTFYFDLKSRYE